MTRIDGKKIAAEIKDELSEDVALLKTKGLIPHLSVVLVGEDPASMVYVRMKGKACEKTGIRSETLTYPATMTQEALLQVVHQLNNNPEVNGILVQSPVPSHIDESCIVDAINPCKDVDGFHPVNVGKLATGSGEGFLPCTPAGVQELLIRSGHDPEGKHVVIVGRSNIVGKPLSLILMQKKKGANATVTVCHSRTSNLSEVTRSADILIAAIGRAEFVTADMVRPGAVVIDVGVNRVDDANSEKGYRLAGDVHFETVSEIAGAITPVPGGVGPMTIAMLLKNTVRACKLQNNIFE